MAINEIILHIGMHKTGTTAIQRALDGYDDGKTAYGDLKIWGDRGPNHGNAIETLFRADFENIPYHRRHGRTKAHVAGYRLLYRRQFDRALSLDRAKLILSGEAIPRLRRAELEALRDELLLRARKVTVIAYVREPVSYLSSMFQQRCRLGHIEPGAALPMPRYRSKFAKFVRVFGADNVHFVKFDRTCLRNGSSVEDLAYRIDIRPDLPSGTSNERLSADATRLLYLLLTRHSAECRKVNHVRPLSQTVHFLQDNVTGPAFALPTAHVYSQLDGDDVAWVEKIAGFTLQTDSIGHCDPSVDLDTDLAVISPEGIGKLIAAMDQLGLRGNPDTQPSDLIAQVYRHFCRKSFLKLRARRAVDAFVSLSGRVARS
ncbi:hypothetical protein GZH79_04440 [Loktanella sp. SALINAS62]|nr:hypothetical protein [Loktanella sp. SALINAS62]